VSDYKTIAESKNFIVLDKYTPDWKVAESYQTEAQLLANEFARGNCKRSMPCSFLMRMAALCGDLAGQTQRRHCRKTRKIHDDYVHDFVFDDGRIQNIRLCWTKSTLPATRCR
jgi:type I restriction enzyme, R subunit